MAAERLARYMSSETAKMLKQFEKMLITIKPMIDEKYGLEYSAYFRQKSLIEFRERVIPVLPFIGGQANPYTTYLVQTAMALAIYRVVMAQKGTLEEAAELIYKGMQLVVSKYPRVLMHLYGRWLNSKIRYPQIRKKALFSRRHVYTGDWVYDFIDGKGQPFSYGIDMHECGIIKFLDAQGASELVPYLCSVDYITYHAMGIELQRSETLAVGCARCNFRIIVSGNPVHPLWPPVFPERENRPSPLS